MSAALLLVYERPESSDIYICAPNYVKHKVNAGDTKNVPWLQLFKLQGLQWSYISYYIDFSRKIRGI